MSLIGGWSISNRCGVWFGMIALVVGVQGLEAHSQEPNRREPVAETTEIVAAMSAEEIARLQHDWSVELRQTVIKLEQEPQSVALWSRRGDLQFFLGQSAEAVVAYDEMIALDPETRSSHWRRGIALYYAKDYSQSAAQFDQYHEYDQVDRENGIWRFLAQAHTDGLEDARRALIPYTQADRPPLPLVYDVFAGKSSPEAFVARFDALALPATQRNSARFYADLYLGLYAIAGTEEPTAEQRAVALKSLQSAVDNRWAITAGYGPNYMWQVARLHRDSLQAAVGNQK